MIWLIIVVVVLFFFCWLLVSPLILEGDTRTLLARVRWISIGTVRIWYEDEWWLSMSILFFRKTMRLSEIKTKPEKRKVRIERKNRKRTMKISRILQKMTTVIKTFRVTNWQLAIDTGDYALNAQLYPLNFLPYTFDHLDINFSDENYLVFKIRSRPWKIVYAFLH